MCIRDSLEYALSIGMKGLGYLTVLPDGSFKGPIDKFRVPEKKAELNSMLNLKTDDTLFFISDNIKVVNLLAGQIIACGSTYSDNGDLIGSKYLLSLIHI